MNVQRVFWRMVAMSLFLQGVLPAAEPLTLKPNDRIVIIGNTFAERLNKAGYFEALLYARFPDLKLTIRNLGFSCDEVVRGKLGTGAGPGSVGPVEEDVPLQLRALNFGDIHTHLHEQKADVIIACYGMMESFAGPEGLPKFERDLESYLRMHLGMNYSGNGSARLVLISPIAHEKLDADFPDPSAHNANLKLYTDSMRKVAEALKIAFIDLYTPTLQIMNDPRGSKLTFNGIHLTDYGNWVVAQIIMEQLGFLTERKIDIDVQAGTVAGSGYKTGALQKTATGLTLALTPDALPVAPPPKNILVQDDLLRKLVVMTVKNLPAGTYELRMGGGIVATAESAAWEKGVRLVLAPGYGQAEQLRRTVDEKNWQFFMHYRAVNGEYIYGRRKDPFGTKSFPPEFETIEKLVTQKDGELWQLSKPTGEQMLELVRTNRQN